MANSGSWLRALVAIAQIFPGRSVCSMCALAVISTMTVFLALIGAKFVSLSVAENWLLVFLAWMAMILALVYLCATAPKDDAPARECAPVAKVATRGPRTRAALKPASKRKVAASGKKRS
jgi:hypothetical protein